jgi:hypothetical protein
MGPAKRACIALSATFLLATAGLPAMASDTYYRWVDENGTPMNSDLPPPPGIKYEKVVVGSGMSRRSPAEEASPAAAESNQPAATPREQAAATGQHASHKDPEACATARQNLDTLNTRARIRMPDGEGGYYFLTEEEKEAQREQARAVITQACE